jgi:hypothetical protein
MTDLAHVPTRDGRTYVHERDGRRLAAQHHRVLAALRNGEWWTLRQLHDRTGDPEASISARLRDLRKPRFGSHNIEREYVQRGLFRYRLKDQAELFE